MTADRRADLVAEETQKLDRALAEARAEPGLWLTALFLRLAKRRLARRAAELRLARERASDDGAFIYPLW